MTDKYAQRPPCTAPELLLKLVLTGTQSHYERRGIIDDKRLEHLLHAGKQILFKSHQESDVRQNLGFSPAVWQGLTSVLAVAIPELENLCFIYKTPNPATYNNSSSELVAANCFTLVKEIERLNDLCTIARNLLATTKRAQNLAADRGFDQQILKLIDVCVKVTARGFDGTNVRVEERHQKVCNLFKRLLITCLQFLHNFIMHNEHRKLVLWLDLFGNSAHQGVAPTAAQVPSNETSRGDHLPVSLSGEKIGVPAEVVDNTTATKTITTQQLDQYNTQADREVLRQFESKHPYTIDDVTELFDAMSGHGNLSDVDQEAARALMARIKSDMENLSGLSAEQLDRNPEMMLKVGAILRAQLAPSHDFTAPYKSSAPQFPDSREVPQSKAASWSGFPDLASYGNLLQDQDITEEDLVMPRTSLTAAETLQEAKDELMARLQDSAPLPDKHDDQGYENGQVVEADTEDEIPDSVEDSMDDDEEEDEDDDYRDPNDQERGLLTDVPLVLGPTEIEALPMIIQAGIVDNFSSVKHGVDRQGARNMQAVRCHILLAQEAGRNVLRELLIFIAAWDLPDDEFYFKMMVQIMEAILKNGLMSHAYSDFGQAKDIISPAQAVVIKILTHIFRSKYSPASSQNNNNNSSSSNRPAPHPKVIAALTRVDVLTVRYIFTVFRGNIIPETCALIYLQGQIRSGLAMAEDFPLNLWDMERVYEGVYQFLEFFAVLTENNDWKRLLVEWEIVYDLVTLLKELDTSILKAPLMPGSGNKQPRDSGALPKPASAVPAAVTERPYEVAGSSGLAQDAQNVPGSSSRPASPPPPTPSEDPSTFEWRNLKKLIILVLSSLVWKNPVVQQQIRDNDGVETVLSCTNYDGHNPYIKEHAVMCLKFLLEGNAENQAIVRDLEAKGVVDTEGIQREYGVNARVGEDGRVKITQAAPPKKALGSRSGNQQAAERARRISRRMSETNAAIELLGERFTTGADSSREASNKTLNESGDGRDARKSHVDSKAKDPVRKRQGRSLRELTEFGARQSGNRVVEVDSDEVSLGDMNDGSEDGDFDAERDENEDDEDDNDDNDEDDHDSGNEEARHKHRNGNGNAKGNDNDDDDDDGDDGELEFM